MIDRDPIAISVLIPTRRGWPDARPTIDAFAAEIDPAKDEIVVIDGSGNPSRPAPATGVRWIAGRQGSVFQLREDGYREVRGTLIAVTEDHCRPVPGWAAGLRRAAAEHPEAVGFGGSVRNGTPATAIDRGAFFITQGPHMAPLPPGPAGAVKGPNVAYRADVIDRLSGRGSLGVIELFDAASLAGADEYFVNDDRIAVYHDQAMGFRATSAVEFHNGRTVASFRRLRPGLGDVLRVLASPILPLYRSIRTVRVVRAKAHRGRAFASALPAIFWLQYCHSAGEVLGYLTGPGNSPRKLR
jgi:hypothetical protein